MDNLWGLLIIAAGSFGQSSSYVPVNKVRQWSWESFWLVQGIFAWLVFPLAGAMLAVPEGQTLWQILAADPASSWAAVGFGVLWGVGGLTFGLSMRYLGIAMGQSISLGTCAAFGTLFPAIAAGTDLFRGPGLTLLAGVCITLVGIAVIGYAGSLRSKDFSGKDKGVSVKEFSLSKGLAVALLAGVMSACFALGLDAGPSVAESPALFRTLPATFLVASGGFLTNAAYCLFQNYRHRSFRDYAKVQVLPVNVLFCALAGFLWYTQFFGLGIGTGFFRSDSVLYAFSWCILMSLNVVFSNVWGLVLKEWKGVSAKTAAVLVAGLVILVFSLVFPNLF